MICRYCNKKGMVCHCQNCGVAINHETWEVVLTSRADYICTCKGCKKLLLDITRGKNNEYLWKLSKNIILHYVKMEKGSTKR